MMNKNGFYTALSRATHEDNIHCASHNKRYVECNKGFVCTPLKQFKSKFNNGAMCTGETIRDIEDRLAQHKRDLNSTVGKVLTKNEVTCSITTIAKCPS